MYFAIIILIVLVLSAIWLFRPKQKDIDNQSIVEHDLENILNNHVEFYKKLVPDQQQRFISMANHFLAETHIEGVGIEVTALDKALIASSAIIPIFGFPDWQYRNLTNIILYPDTFDNDFQFEGDGRNIMGMVGSGYMNGQMLLSRQALVKAFAANGGKENTAIHEFVHLLDKSDGSTDGVPENFLPHEYAKPWLQLMHQEMQKIQQGKSDINPYGLTNEAEFFAVASEYFFEKPDKFKEKHPELYDLMSQIFAQQPAG
ncbi:zinc-dependent peptidase [Mucilaginibacter sp. RS28]|uniref:Zinc-dependent peptidase n=1 Tax=Mucilaginibacter straminoryzae TaxID=2932774 RepID=A0A9X1X1Y7_9SPHI|nr:M90 family metallopeptidase [Mucilaginibacter straminoryzae]MCJ8209752.1 zinc-dependent peptidase [Mucilaginibacter straminoryzae]